MNGNLNQGAWKTMENEWAKALGQGKKVKVIIDTVYNGNSMRPLKFLVEYLIDGQTIRKTFNNVVGG
jgi:filamentous hemagglutinin